MKFPKLLLAGAAALALVSCGKKDANDGPSSRSSVEAADADAGSPLDSKYKLKDAEPVDIDAFFALMPEASRPTYESVAFDEGIGATVVSNLRFADSNDGEGVMVARAEFYGLDMEAIDRVKAAEGGADAPFETIFQKVRFFDVVTEGFEEGPEAVDMTVGGVEFDQLQIRQGRGKRDGEAGKGAEFFNAVSFAGVYVKDATFKTTSDEAPSVDMTIPDFRMVSVGGGKIAAIIFNDLDYTVNQSDASIAAMQQVMGPEGAMFMNSPLGGLIAPKSQRVTVEEFVWRDIDFSGLLAWGVKGEKPPASEEDLMDLGTMKASNMETYINGKRAAVVADATMSAAEFTWFIPSNIRMDTKGAVYDLTAYVPEGQDAAVKVLTDYGLDNIKGDGKASWIYNSKSGIADLDYVVNMDKFADFSAKLGLSGLKLADIDAAMADGDENVIRSLGAFKNLSLRIEDDKALDAIFAIAGIEMGQSGEELRNSMPVMIRMMGGQAAEINPRVSGYVNAFADWVAQGGSLEISANPAEPVAFSALQATSATAPQTLPDVIDLKVTHEE